MKPIESEIHQTIRLVKVRLAHKDIEKPINRAIKEEYIETINILVEGRQTYDGIDKVNTLQGRAIAVLAVDYLNGECAQKVLVNVPFKI